MRVFLTPTGLYSRAMTRIANALTIHKPDHIQIVSTIAESDLVILYAIGPDTEQTVTDLKESGKKYAIVQCCLMSAGLSSDIWCNLWQEAETVWSYYDLMQFVTGNKKMPLSWNAGFNFYYAPLGIDQVFVQDTPGMRDIDIISSGYVSGSASEAIEEVANVAQSLNQKVIHIGPKKIEGMALRSEHTWRAIQPSDSDLARVYSRSRFVSGLRYVEGFELPVIEGLSLGCRPIVFDRPETRKWFDCLGVRWIKECSGSELESELIRIMSTSPVVTEDQIQECRARFDWKTIIEGFWERLA